MKYLICCMTAAVASAIPVLAVPPSKFETASSKSKPSMAEAKYVSESPLPEGWPQPGPFYQVTRKNYPAYRAAITADSNSNGGFWRLFKHIEKNEIPMTSPVEMKMDDADPSGMKMEEMLFLYQSPKVGKTGADGAQIEVKDMPALRTLSYAWQGPRDKAAIARARQAIDAELAKNKLKATGYRIFGYNSPFIPRGKQTFELQAVLSAR